MKIRENEALRDHTTFRTGGPARFFAEAQSADDIREALNFAASRALPLAVLGGGSNLLASDAGFDGLVVKIANCGISVVTGQDGATEVVAEAGQEWDELVAWTVERELFGLENLSLIPGRVGAAIVGNIGAYGTEVKDVAAWADALDRNTGEIRRFPRAACAFAYRDSFFKSPEGRHYIVVRAAFRLRQQGQLNPHYRDVSDYLSARQITAPTLADMRAAVVDIRRRKLPDLAHVGTAGSFFKNPIISRPAYDVLTAQYPGLPGHVQPDGLVKVPLGWILDKICGLRGARVGRVGTHNEQALVVVSNGATTAEISAFARQIAGDVKARTGIDIVWEVERLG